MAYPAGGISGLQGLVGLGVCFWSTPIIFWPIVAVAVLIAALFYVAYAMLQALAQLVVVAAQFICDAVVIMCNGIQKWFDHKRDKHTLVPLVSDAEPVVAYPVANLVVVMPPVVINDAEIYTGIPVGHMMNR